MCIVGLSFMQIWLESQGAQELETGINTCVYMYYEI